MDVQTVLQELESLGTAQNRKVYARHGVGEPLYGVSYANLGRVEKRIIAGCLCRSLIGTERG